MLNRNGKINGNGNFDWSNALADAVIMAGLTFFTTLGGLGATGLLSNPALGFTASIISAGGEFFAILVIKRGLKEKK